MRWDEVQRSRKFEIGFGPCFVAGRPVRFWGRRLPDDAELCDLPKADLLLGDTLVKHTTKYINNLSKIDHEMFDFR